MRCGNKIRQASWGTVVCHHGNDAQEFGETRLPAITIRANNRKIRMLLRPLLIAPTACRSKTPRWPLTNDGLNC